MCRGTSSRVEACSRRRADTQGTASPAGSPESRALTGRGLQRTVPMWFARVLAGRATRPRPRYPRTVSTAFEDPASTRLGQFFGLAADQYSGLSGFSLLGHGREAFIVRLALADLAERSLDMQYYVWDGDTTGRIIVDRVMKAADRGVKVRLLIDDPYYKASDPVIAALDAHPGVEIRLFNPLTNRGWPTLDFILDFRRVNRRMHNKLMVADNAAAIVGGRNIGDIYYGVNTIANYRDLDVLAVGPVVRDLSRVFDRYWNSPSTVPIAAIADRTYGAADLDAILICLCKEIAAADYPYPIDQDLDELASRGAELHDRPSVGARPHHRRRPGSHRPRRRERRRGRVHPRARRPAEEGAARRVALFRPARPGAGNVKALHERHVRVRVLTNSLASNDMLAAHSGYAKTRRRLLENGMELYELRPDTDAFRSGWSLLSGGSRAALHAKAMAFDREAVFIGSFNLDPRSAVINTEAGLYIESLEFTERLTAYMATGVVLANSFRVLLASDGGIVWETVRDGQTVRYRDEPGNSLLPALRRQPVEAPADRPAALTAVLSQLGYLRRRGWRPARL